MIGDENVLDDRTITSVHQLPGGFLYLYGEVLEDDHTGRLAPLVSRLNVGMLAQWQIW